MTKQEFRAAFPRPLCPVCHRGDVTNSFAQEREHTHDCKLVAYNAQCSLWKKAT